MLRVLRLHNLQTLRSQTETAFVEENAKAKLFQLCFTVFSLLSCTAFCHTEWLLHRFISTGIIHMSDRTFSESFEFENKVRSLWCEH